MLRRPALPLVALGALLAACQNAERSVAPGLDGPQFSLSAAEGLKGRIAFRTISRSSGALWMPRRFAQSLRRAPKIASGRHSRSVGRHMF